MMQWEVPVATDPVVQGKEMEGARETMYLRCFAKRYSKKAVNSVKKEIAFKQRLKGTEKLSALGI